MTGLLGAPCGYGVAVYRLTGSNAALGIMDFAASIPIVFLTAIAGAMIERWDLRKTLFCCQAGCMPVALILAFLTITDLVTFHIIVFMSLMLGVLDSFELPCRHALVSYLVEKKDDITNAVALNSTNFNLARMFAPTVAGVVIHVVGEGLCFMFNGLAYSSTLFALRRMDMKEAPIGRSDGGKRELLKEAVEGFRIANNFVPSRYLLILIAVTGFFAFPAIVLMPAMAKSVLDSTSAKL
ncbi:MAG: MFS transporter [Synergistaceae bacterium]